jgi:hypothetical protein
MHLGVWRGSLNGRSIRMILHWSESVEISSGPSKSNEAMLTIGDDPPMRVKYTD